MRSSRDLVKRSDLAMVEWIDLEARPLPESVKELTKGKGADLILDVVGGPSLSLAWSRSRNGEGRLPSLPLGMVA